MTLQRLVTLRKHVHPGIQTPTTSPCLAIRKKNQRSGTLQRLVTLRKHVHPGIHTATINTRLVTRQKTGTPAFIQHDKSVFSDMAKKSEFSDGVQRLLTLKKHMHPGVPTSTTSPCLVTRQKSQCLVTLRKGVHPDIHTATTSLCSVTRQKS